MEQYISKFDAISVREEAAKSIIERITNRQDVEVLIDPTMMLQKEEWDRIVKNQRKCFRINILFAIFWELKQRNI